MRKILVPVLAVFAFTFFCVSSLKAQCKYQVILLSNDTLSANIDCDFPVKPGSGNAANDSAAFIVDLKQWAVTKNYNLLIPNTTGVSDFYFLISQNSFATYSEERKSALRKYPQLFRITQ